MATASLNEVAASWAVVKPNLSDMYSYLLTGGRACMEAESIFRWLQKAEYTAHGRWNLA
jgi:hypothetical protein